MTTPTTPLTFAAPATPLSLLAPGTATHPHAATLLRAAAVCAAPVDSTRTLDVMVHVDCAAAFRDALRAASDAVLGIPFPDMHDAIAWEDMAQAVGLSPFRDQGLTPRGIIGRLAGASLALLTLADEQEADDALNAGAHAPTTRALALSLTQIAEAVRFAVAPHDDPVAAHVEAHAAYAVDGEPRPAVPHPVTPVPTVLPLTHRRSLRIALLELERAEAECERDVQRAFSDACEAYDKATGEAVESMSDALGTAEIVRDDALAWVRDQINEHGIDDHKHPLMQLAVRLVNMEFDEPRVADLKYDNSVADEGVEFQHDVPSVDAFDAEGDTFDTDDTVDERPAGEPRVEDFSVNG